MAPSYGDEISRLELLHQAHPDGLVFPHLADAYRRAGRFSHAEQVLDAGLRRHADYSSAHLVLGRLRMDQGQRDEARAAFQRVLKLDPQNHVALEHLGRLAAQEGRRDEALQHYRSLHRLSPSDEIAERIAELEEKTRPDSGTRGNVSNGGGDGARQPRPERRARAAAEEPGPDVHEAEVPEPGEVVTETMAELYARQGLYGRAAAVYRQLLRTTPGDTRLKAKLEQVERRRISDPGPTTEAVTRAAPDATAATAATADPADSFDRPEARQTPPASTPIAEELSALLAWRATPQERREPEQAAEAVQAPPAPAPDRPQDRTGRSERAQVSPEPSVNEGVPGFEAAGPQVRALLSLTDLLVGLLEYRDPFFRGSSSLTRLMATSIGDELDLTPEEHVDLALAAVLRDLGRLALGGRLLPQARLTQTPETRRRIERHVDLALNLLEGIDVPEPVRQAVRHHHERWDGAGYPDALSGESIPRLARILAVADSFAAMVSPRPYRLPRKVPDAAREIQDEAGARYDPAVVDALLRVLAGRDRPHLGFVQRHHILLVNPDQPGAVVTAAKLCSAGYLAEVAVDPDAARERLRRVPVAALVVSAEAGAEEAAAFIRALRVDSLLSSLPVVVVDAEGVGLRVRLLESGADVCFPAGISYAELQGTLGAMVRRTLRNGRDGGTSDRQGEAPWLALQGDVQDFPLTWLLQVMKYDARTAAIGIRTSRDQGAIYLNQGDAVHAKIKDGATGEAALRKMLTWKKGRFAVQPDTRPRERTISTSIMHLLLTQAVDQDHAAAGIFGAVSDEG